MYSTTAKIDSSTCNEQVLDYCPAYQTNSRMHIRLGFKSTERLLPQSIFRGDCTPYDVFQIIYSCGIKSVWLLLAAIKHVALVVVLICRAKRFLESWNLVSASWYDVEQNKKAQAVLLDLKRLISSTYSFCDRVFVNHFRWNVVEPRYISSKIAFIDLTRYCLYLFWKNGNSIF